MASAVAIPARFNGPPCTAHGGYACGVAAALVDSTVAQTALPVPMVSGTIVADLRGRLFTGQEYVVQGWRLGREGRKLYSASAVFTPDGTLVAACRQTWIQLQGPPAA